MHDMGWPRHGPFFGGIKSNWVWIRKEQRWIEVGKDTDNQNLPDEITAPINLYGKLRDNHIPESLSRKIVSKRYPIDNRENGQGENWQGNRQDVLHC